MRALGGWQRLGIIIWFVAVFSYAFAEYREVSSEHARNFSLPAPPKGFVLDPETNPYFFIWQPVDLLAKNTSSYVRDFEFNFVRFVVILLGPAISVWLLAITVGWIKQGFKDKTDS